MSEKRFERWNDHSCKVKDNQEDRLLNWEDVVQKLNEQQEHITHLEDTNDNFRIKLIEDIEAMEQAEKKIGEQQATIDMQELRLQRLEELLELSENLNKSYREKLIDMNLKMVIGDE